MLIGSIYGCRDTFQTDEGDSPNIRGTLVIRFNYSGRFSFENAKLIVFPFDFSAYSP